MRHTIASSGALAAAIATWTRPSYISIDFAVN